MRCCGRASRKEIAALAAPRHTVVFLPDAQRVADWTLDGAQMAVEALLAEPEVDNFAVTALSGFGSRPM